MIRVLTYCTAGGQGKEEKKSQKRRREKKREERKHRVRSVVFQSGTCRCLHFGRPLPNLVPIALVSRCGPDEIVR